jgi:hypothetical protein
MLNRRTFMTSTLAAGVMGSAIARPSQSIELSAEPWTARYFEQRQGQRFRLMGAGDGVATLVAVERCDCDRRTESFHVRFEVECDEACEGIYQLTRPIAGRCSLFLQPRGRIGDRRIMEATVNRLRV